MLHISTVSVFSFFSIIFLGGGHPIKDTAPQCQKIPVVALFVAPKISGSTHLTQFFHGAKRASNLVSIMAKKWLCLLWSPIFLLTKRYHTYHWWPMVQIPHFMGFCIPIFFWYVWESSASQTHHPCLSYYIPISSRWFYDTYKITLVKSHS